MNNYPVEVARAARSKSGRDKGRLFLIIEVLESPYVLIADGKLRRLERPKKKKLKHLELQPEQFGEIQEKLEQGTKVLDAEIRNALRTCIG